MIKYLRKTWIGLILLVIFVPKAYAGFTDVSDTAWYRGYAERALGEGWFSGFEDGSFRPNQTLTRAECAKVLFTYQYGKNLPAAQNHYADVAPGTWYEVYAGVNEQNQAIACANNLFRPDEPMTRAGAVAALMRVSGIHTQNAEFSVLKSFSDVDQVSAQDAPYLAEAVSAGLLKGIEGRIAPDEPVTRAQFAKLLTEIYSSDWKTGSILPDDGSIVWSDTRIYSRLMYLPASMGSVDFSEYKLAFDYYNADKKRIFNSGWLTEKTYLPPGFYRIIIAHQDDTEIYPGEGGAFCVDYNVTTFSETGLKYIAHRGLAGCAPENTIESLIRAAQAGFQYSECDVRWTADGVPMILHDETIDRTSDGSGRLSDMTFEQVRQYDFGSWKDEEFEGTEIPSFEEYISTCRDWNIRPYLDIYDSDVFTVARAQQLIDIVRKYGMEKRVTWLSNWISTLQRIKSVDPSAALRLMYVTMDMKENYIRQMVSLKTETNEVGIDTDCTALDENCIRQMKAAGFSVECWSTGEFCSPPNGVTGITYSEIE